MDFREHQDRAKSNSLKIWLLYLLLVAVASLLTGVLASLLAFVLSDHAHEMSANGEFLILQGLQSYVSAIMNTESEYNAILVFFSGISFAIIGVSTLFGFLKSSNGHDVAEAFGGIHTTLDSPNLTAKERMALNIIDELSLASSLTPPAFYVLNDPAINAFAAGKDREHSVVAITQGALEHLNRDELSAIIGHELGHIANEDIKLNIKISAFVLGFTVLFFIAKLLFSATRGGRSKDARAKIVLLVIALILFIVGLFSVFMGRILQAMMSRQREFLADASAVQFTRNPNSLIQAFEKIKAHSYPTQLQSPLAKEMSHALFFGSGGSLFATHPPLDERIKRLKSSINNR